MDEVTWALVLGIALGAIVGYCAGIADRRRKP